MGKGFWTPTFIIGALTFLTRINNWWNQFLIWPHFDRFMHKNSAFVWNTDNVFMLEINFYGKFVFGKKIFVFRCCWLADTNFIIRKILCYVACCTYEHLAKGLILQKTCTRSTIINFRIFLFIATMVVRNKW